VLCFSNTVSAQTSKTSFGVKIAYNATIIYPGFLIGVECPVKRIVVTRHRMNGSVKHFDKLRFLSADLGYYHHRNFHDNLYLLAGWVMRKQRPRGFFTEFSPAIGYSRTFLGAETYHIAKSGTITLHKFAGYNYAIAAIRGGFGYAFRPSTSAYFRASLLTMFPSNNLLYLRPTLELGIIWRPSHFLETRPQISSNSKGKIP